MGPLAKVIRLKLFLDTVPSSFADITRASRGCFRGRSVYVSFRFVLKCYCDQKSILLFLVFQNYVTEPLSDQSFKPSFQKETCLF